MLQSQFIEKVSTKPKNLRTVWYKRCYCFCLVCLFVVFRFTEDKQTRWRNFTSGTVHSALVLCRGELIVSVPVVPRWGSPGNVHEDEINACRLLTLHVHAGDARGAQDTEACPWGHHDLWRDEESQGHGTGYAVLWWLSGRRGRW